MMERLEERLRAISAERTEAALARLEAAELPADAAIERTGDGVAISGRRLGWRTIEDARLRDFALAARR